MEPEFSPDGKWIAFGSDRSGSGSELWVANADGANLRPLTKGWGGIVSRPRWSPDGRSIVFHAHTHFEGWGVYVINAAGGPPRQLATDLPPSLHKNERAPSWSHDGQWIYFQSDCTERNEIYRAPWQGGAAVRVTQNGGTDPLPSRDGKSLYFARNGGLVQRTLDDSGTEHLVCANVRGRWWTVGGNEIYMLQAIGDDRFYRRGFEVVLRKLGSETERVLCQSPRLRSGPHGLTVSPDRKTILLIASETDGADLMLVENLR